MSVKPKEIKKINNKSLSYSNGNYLLLDKYKSFLH